MRFDGYDFIILGAVLGVGGGLFFARPTPFLMEATQTYLNSNPFQVRNSITAHHTRIFSVIWIVAGLIATIYGTVRAARFHQKGYLLDEWFDIVVLVAGAIVLWRLTTLTIDWTSRVQYVPVISNLQREAYEQSVFILNHSGYTREESERGRIIRDDILEQRLEGTTGTLNQIGKLLDEPRAPREDNLAYARRLSHYFPTVSWEP